MCINYGIFSRKKRTVRDTFASRFCFPYTITSTGHDEIPCLFTIHSISANAKILCLSLWLSNAILNDNIIIYVNKCNARGAVVDRYKYCCPPNSCCGMSHRVIFFFYFYAHSASVFRARHISTIYLFIYINNII